MRSDGVITGVSVSHREASIEEIEAATAADERTVVRDLLAGENVEEAFALQTCNRAEAYVVTDDAAAGRRALADFAPSVHDAAVVGMDHEESLEHLMRVAAGLESLVVGEDQILGQFRTAVEEARAVGGVGTLLEDALTKALHVGERARTETGINEGVVSLGSAAVELAGESVDLGAATVLVVGAGEMGTLTAKALAAAGVDRLVVANRTVPHAEHVVDSVDVPGSAVGLDAAPEAAAAADVVVTATGSGEPVLTGADLADAGETVVIDIARPRDVDPAAADVAGVTLRDIDALKSVTESTRQARREEAAAVEEMVTTELEHLLESFKRKRADEAISRMYESAERMKAREVETALSKLEAEGEVTADEREVVESLADALVGQLLAAPTKSLREAAVEDDWTTIQTAMHLFDPEFDGPPASPDHPTESPGVPPEGPDGRAGGRPDDIPEDADVPGHVLDQLSDD